MGGRTSTAARYIVDEVASPAATKRLFGIDDKRAATLTKWAEEALQAVEGPPPRKASVHGVKRLAKKSAVKS